MRTLRASFTQERKLDAPRDDGEVDRASSRSSRPKACDGSSRRRTTSSTSSAPRAFVPHAILVGDRAVAGREHREGPRRSARAPRRRPRRAPRALRPRRLARTRTTSSIAGIAKDPRTASVALHARPRQGARPPGARRGSRGQERRIEITFSARSVNVADRSRRHEPRAKVWPWSRRSPMFRAWAKQRSLNKARAGTPSARRHRVYVTRNTEYHFRDGFCVAVRDRRSGDFSRATSRVRRRLQGGAQVLPERRDRARTPAILGPARRSTSPRTAGPRDEPASSGSSARKGARRRVSRAARQPALRRRRPRASD